MSIAQGAQIKELQQEVLELSRTLTDTKAMIRDLDQRLAKIEQARKPGPKPKEAQ